MTLTIAVAYGGREEIADAVRDLIRAKVRDGLGVDEPMGFPEHITPASIAPIYLHFCGRPFYGSRILYHYLHRQRYERCGYQPALLRYAQRFIANSTLRTSIGRRPAKVDFLRAIRSFQQRTRRFGAVTRATEKEALAAGSKECQQ